MRKIFLAPIALLAAGTAFGATLAVNELNVEVAKLIAPFQNEQTAASVVFKKIETNAERALSASVALLYRKVGSENSLEINIPELSYEYGNGSTPTTKLDGAVKLDLTKLIPQEQLNDIIPSLEEMIQGLALGFAKEYGEAATVSVELTENNQDANGNYKSLKGILSFEVNTAKLPANLKIEEVPVLSGTLEIGLEVNAGAVLKAVVVSNPSYKRFQRENTGLKDVLDRLLAKDPETLAQINSLLASLDRFAESFVNGSN